MHTCIECTSLCAAHQLLRLRLCSCCCSRHPHSHTHLPTLSLSHTHLDRAHDLMQPLQLTPTLLHPHPHHSLFPCIPPLLTYTHIHTWIERTSLCSPASSSACASAAAAAAVTCRTLAMAAGPEAGVPGRLCSWCWVGVEGARGGCREAEGGACGREACCWCRRCTCSPRSCIRRWSSSREGLPSRAEGAPAVGKSRYAHFGKLG
jgi:hypothetical protein